MTGLAVSDDYIVTQFFLEPAIHVYRRADHKLLHQLEGHEYGGQAIVILGSILYSGSKDRSMRSWDLETGDELCEAKDHRDYIHTVQARYAGGSVTWCNVWLHCARSAKLGLSGFG